MNFTSQDLVNLKAALISGALEVQIGDRRIKYRSQSEILAAIEMIQMYLDGVAEESPDLVQATFTKGSS